LANNKGRPVYIYEKDNRGKIKLVDIIGDELRGEPIKMLHTASHNGNTEGHWEPHLTKRDIKKGKVLNLIDGSGKDNCGFAAAARQIEDIGSAAELREQLAKHIATSPHTAPLRAMQQHMQALNTKVLMQGGSWRDAEVYMMETDPHSFHNRLLLSSNEEYRALENALRAADQRGDKAKSQELASQLRKIEIKEFEINKEAQRRVAKAAAVVGTGVAVSTLKANAGAPFIASYLAGAGATSGLSIGMDGEVRGDVKEGNWIGALNRGSYHLPFVGTSRSAWDSWQTGNYLGAAGHAGLLGVEVWDVWGVGTVRWGDGGKNVGFAKVGKGAAKMAEKAKASLKALKGNLSGKEASKDIPDWVRGLRPKVGESGKDFAKKLMHEKYGPGNYTTGPKTEFNKIKKWADRAFE
jgi:hypothetical protein